MIKDLIDKLLHSRLTKKEARFLDKWLRSDSSDPYFSEKLDEIIKEDKESGNSYPEWQPELLKVKILENIRSSAVKESLKLKETNEKTRFRFSFRPAAVAASIALLIGFSVYFLGTDQSEKAIETSVEQPWLVKSNPAGKKTIVHLNDGSRVYLNSESSISYPQNFSENRSVKLQGEAFFEVFRDTLHPFTVDTRDLKTTVLGTSFNIKSFSDEFKTSLILATGQVKAEVKGVENPFLLLPGEGISIAHGDSSNLVNVFQANIKETLYWKEGILHFDKIPFMDLIKELERWYGIEINIAGKYPVKGGFSGTFKNNENLINVLETLKFSEEFTYQTSDKKVYIQF
jgi:ferric-dicitrate binding protein FerR (iron transport regulator)